MNARLFRKTTDGFFGKDLNEVDQLDAIAEVIRKSNDFNVDNFEPLVAPPCENLLLDFFPAVILGFSLR
uniref:Uncharacterized protein n=1 Tax=Amphimedon queenslandica TaxID=400682 RepID=A0A1X7V2T0_AMPQE